MDVNFWIAILATAIRAGTPILYTSLGELITERSGVLNLGLEGIMLMGAVTSFIAAMATGNVWIGVLVAMLTGALLCLAFSILVVSLRVNQVVAGLAMVIFCTGFSAQIGNQVIGKPLVAPFKEISIPFLSDIPYIGQVFFRHDPLVYLGLFFALIIWVFIYKSKPGLILRSVGETPDAADSMGINVPKVRYLATTIGGALIGLGGAYLSLAYAPTWIEMMTAGRGWIALALVIAATWHPLRAVAVAWLFGGIDALSLRLQTLGTVEISSFILRMLPYIFTVLVLIVSTKGDILRRIGAPQALGKPYEREER